MQPDDRQGIPVFQCREDVNSPGKDASKKIDLPSGRTLGGYAHCSGRAISDGSAAQMMYFVEDAKKDIAYLAALAMSPQPASTALVERHVSEEVAVTNALAALNHALMVLDVPESSAKRRAWSSLIDARDALSTASQFDIMDATPGMVAAAMSVDWEADIPQENLIHNIWHAMFFALSEGREPRQPTPTLLEAAKALISVFDEQSNVAQRIITSGKSDRQLREDGLSAINDLRTAVSALSASTSREGESR